jgi:prolyl-tRNA synthetase
LVILDKALEGRTNLIAGANKEEYHLRNVTPTRDFKPTLVADVRNVSEGEGCPIDGSPLRIGKAVEIGHIFKLGYKYSKSMGASVLNRDGKEVTLIMGSYGIGIERILTAAIESSAAANDGAAFALHPAIAPFQVVVTVTNTADPALQAAGEKIAAELTSAGVDVLLDDRDERAGVKFKDADLIGIPYRINIGRGVAEGKVEFVDRLNRHMQEVALEQVASTVADQITSVLQPLLPASAVKAS